MADPLLGFTLAQQGVDLSSSSTLASLSAQVAKPPVFQETAAGSPSNVSPTTTAAPLLRYPIKRIDASSDYLEIKVLEYVAAGFDLGRASGSAEIATASSNANQQKPLAYIQLPIPENITDNQTIGWGSDTLDPFTALKLSAAGRLINNPADLPNLIEDLKNTAVNTYQTGGLQDQLKSFLAAKAVNVVGGNIETAQVRSRATGSVLNPNMELLFTGPGLRSFPFVFTFTPREAAESQEVKKIIWTLKKHMVAKRVSGGLFIKTPDIFQLTYKTGSRPHPFLNKFKPAALTDISVNYTGSGTYATYSDATPIHIVMSLQFTELNPIYFDDYASSDQNVGY